MMKGPFRHKVVQIRGCAVMLDRIELRQLIFIHSRSSLAGPLKHVCT